MFAPEIKVVAFDVSDIITASADVPAPCGQDWSGECPTD